MYGRKNHIVIFLALFTLIEKYSIARKFIKIILRFV